MKRKIIFWRILEIVFTLIWIAIFICSEMVDFENMDVELCLAFTWYGMFLLVLGSWCVSMGTNIYRELKNQGCWDIFASKDFWISVLVGLFLRCNLCLRIFLMIIFVFYNWIILGGLYDCLAIHAALIAGWLLCELLFARKKFFTGIHGKARVKKFAAGLVIVVVWLGASVMADRHIENRRFDVFYQAMVVHEEQQQDLPLSERTAFYTDYKRGRQNRQASD